MSPSFSFWSHGCLEVGNNSDINNQCVILVCFDTGRPGKTLYLCHSESGCTSKSTDEEKLTSNRHSIDAWHERQFTGSMEYVKESLLEKWQNLQDYVYHIEHDHKWWKLNEWYNMALSSLVAFKPLLMHGHTFHSGLKGTNAMGFVTVVV